MTFRQSLLFGVAAVALAGTAHAQQRGQSRDDLLDALTRHIQICAEIGETQARLACYDRLQTQVGGVQPPARPPAAAAAPAAPTPTPLQAPSASSAPAPAPSTGSSIGSAPLAPQPLGVPGGGVATLGGSQPSTGAPGTTPYYDPDAAFDPRSAASRPPANLGPKPQHQVRRTGQRPIPSSPTPQPLVTLGANNLTYGESRYWQVTVSLTSNTQRPVTAQAVCTFMNGGRPIEDVSFGPLSIQPGEQVTTELVGPPTSTYVDSTNCRVVSP
jgi:hypothetical protein